MDRYLTLRKLQTESPVIGGSRFSAAVVKGDAVYRHFCIYLIPVADR